MHAATACAAVSLLALLTLLPASVSGQTVAGHSIRLSLFNDSACTTPLPVPGVDEPAPLNGLDVCTAATPSLAAVGYAAYEAGCGVSIGSNLSFAIANLYANSSAAASTCPSSTATPSLRTYISVLDSNLTHTGSSCVGPIGVYQIANASVRVAAYNAWVQWDCDRSNPNAAFQSHSASAVTALLLLALACLVVV